MPRTPRKSQTHFSRPAPTAVLYDLSVPDEATIHVPAGSKWTSGPHWHESHTEFLRVLSGRAFIILGERSFVAGPDDETVTVPRGVVHEWMRVFVGEEEDAVTEGGRGGKGEELVVREWTEPRDGGKEVFFRNLNGIILDATAKTETGWRRRWGDKMLELDLWNLFWRADNYPVVWGTGFVGGVATKVVMGAAVALGWVLGFKGVYKEYALERKSFLPTHDAKRDFGVDPTGSAPSV
ncbi:uncharacterized protein F4822DRAFT_91795 [Hypoxylon trugodes]|uniref:uncharacterized protein n=1 Tax=Hypoxylon trugodes TaxID=326681 RepID=UPI0021998F5D|nr:uncharacterized protein F4822DRAFT_91795 [Hypoxylon trugodes]KAI1383070.1 hypothetical protein F4822DRAFT_91795 [Hypoxylon trugodes]